MIPLEQGSVFRLRRFCNNAINLPSQSLWNRAVSSDIANGYRPNQVRASQSLWNRAVSFDIYMGYYYGEQSQSQSLWNRAVSFDDNGTLEKLKEL